jgi:O-antigen/teichoic acid export membrane protein
MSQNRRTDGTRPRDGRTDDRPTDGPAASGLTRAFSSLGAAVVVLCGVAAGLSWLVAAAAWSLLVGAVLALLVVGAVLYGARRARKTSTPYWRT